MRKSQLLSIVRSFLPPDTSWPDNQSDIQLEGGKTVLMLVMRVPDPQLADKLVDYVCRHATNFWALDSCGRHAIMDACYHGVHPTVLLRLVKWARRYSFKVITPMSLQDINGLDALEIAVQGGHGELVSCLLEQRDPESRDHLLCVQQPLKALELAIESGNERCVTDILANKRVVDRLQPGKAERLNLIARWTQRQTSMKRLYNIFTCVGAAVRCGMTGVVEYIYKLNPEETRQATWYAVRSCRRLEISPEVQRIANSYLLTKVWSQIGELVLLRHCRSLKHEDTKCTRRERIRRWWQYGHGRRDWDTNAAHPWITLPSEIFSLILGFLLPSETETASKMASLVEF